MTHFFTGGAFAALREGFARYKIGEESVFCKFCRAVFFVEYRLKPSLYMAEIGSTRTDNPIDFSNFEPIKLSYMTQELKFFPRWSFLKYIPRIHKLNLQSKLESLFKFSRSIFFLRVWLLLFLLSILGCIDSFYSDIIDVPRTARYLLCGFTCVFKSTLLTLALFYSRRCKPLLTGVVAIIGIYCILCLLNGISYLLYGMGITIKLFTILSQTHHSEVVEFIPTLFHNLYACFLTPQCAVIITIIALLFVACKYIPSKVFAVVTTITSLIGFGAFIMIISCAEAGRMNFSVFARTVKSCIQAYQENRQVKALMDSDREIPYVETIDSKALCDIVLVIGESASRNHHSIYGYPLATSPHMKNLGDSLIIFTDAIASSTTTAFNINRILTFLYDSDDATRWSESPSLFDIFSHTDYKTAWISNQEKSGTWSNNTIALIRNADTTIFAGGTSSDDATLQKHDDILLPYVERFMKQSEIPKLIGIHLMGSHTLYRRRYPAAFRNFSADSVMAVSNRRISRDMAGTIAEYDNSIAFTDSILSRIIGMSAVSERPAVVIYFSDHGENVYDGGDFIGRDELHVEVPFLVYPNKAFRLKYPEMTERLSSVSDKPFSTANVIHMILTLSGTSYRLYADSLDIISPRYRIRPRYVDDHVWKYENSVALKKTT